MNYRLAIFDFDGTLADSFDFFVSSYNQIADEFAFSRIDETEVDALRHHSAREMMKRVGLPAWKLPAVSQRFIAVMRANAPQLRPFDGVETALAELAARGVQLAVVSSNAADNVAAILGPAIMTHISHVDCGMSIFGKAARLRKTLRACRIAANEAIYVGDQLTDLEAARRAGIAFGAVAWGYADPAALRAQRPDRMLEQVADIVASLG
ncbi:MAG: HAD hydrolase-like protein [Azoarcus sp.]|nr:HAD hydrolase-like protein [Azoarcus sp.]